MKKILVALAFALVATQAQAVIAGSSHDLTGAVAGKPSCNYCHAAHVFTTSGVTTNYLWNRNLAAATVVTAGVETLTCLTCHDGNTSIYAVNNGTSGASTLLTGTMDIAATTAELGNDHPVAVTYSTTNTGASLLNLSSATAAGARFFGAGSNQMECASCHDVHAGENYKFLFTAFACTGCHQK